MSKMILAFTLIISSLVSTSALAGNWVEKPQCSLHSSQTSLSYEQIAEMSRHMNVVLCLDDQKFGHDELAAMVQSKVTLAVLGNKTWVDAYALTTMAPMGKVQVYLENSAPVDAYTLGGLAQSGVRLVLNLRNDESSFHAFTIKSLRRSGVFVQWQIDNKDAYEYFTVTDLSRSGISVRILARPYEYDGFELQRLEEAGVQVLLQEGP